MEILPKIKIFSIFIKVIGLNNMNSNKREFKKIMKDIDFNLVFPKKIDLKNKKFRSEFVPLKRLEIFSENLINIKNSSKLNFYSPQLKKNNILFLHTSIYGKNILFFH